MTYDTINNRWQKRRLRSDCQYWQQYGSTGQPEITRTIVRFEDYGTWRCDAVQEGYGFIEDQWQWTDQESGHTVMLPQSLTGVPLVQALYDKAREKLA